MRQVRLLARTFFVRLFESDLMPPGLPQVQLVIWSVVLVATPALTLPGVFIQKYTRLWYEPGTLGPAIATDRLVLLTLAMIAAGLVAIVVWENALPDRRDARILGALPVSTRAFVTGRLLALAQLFSLFFATLGLIPSVFFSGIAAAYDEPGGFVGMSIAQLAAALAGALTTFCGVIALQCIVISSLGRAMAQRAAVVIQMLFAIALVQMIVFLPSLGRSMKDGNLGSRLAVIACGSDAALGVVPGSVRSPDWPRRTQCVPSCRMGARRNERFGDCRRCAVRLQLSGVGRAGTRNSAAGHHVVRSLAPPRMEAVRSRAGWTSSRQDGGPPVHDQDAVPQPPASHAAGALSWPRAGSRRVVDPAAGTAARNGRVRKARRRRSWRPLSS